MYPKAQKDKICAFARKWMYRFADQEVSDDSLFSPSLERDVKALGFDIDELLNEEDYIYVDTYPDKKMTIKEIIAFILVQIDLRRVILQDNDSFMQANDRGLFIEAFSDLAKKCGQDLHVFKKKAAKIMITSYRDLKDDMSSRFKKEDITITHKSCIIIKTDINGDIEKTRYKVDSDLIDKIASHFNKGYHQYLEDHRGHWSIMIKDEDGDTFKTFSSFYRYDDDISVLLRNELNDDSIWALDGKCIDLSIEKIGITLAYGKDKMQIEKIILDKKMQALYLEKIDQIGTSSIKVYKDKTKVQEIFDKLGDDAFKELSDDEAYIKEGEFKEILWDIKYRNGQNDACLFPKDTKRLPKDLAIFILLVRRYIEDNDHYDLLDLDTIKRKRRDGELILCSVKFTNGERIYHYLSEDESLRVGDEVMVPVSNDDKAHLATIFNIQYIKEDRLPIPKSKLKYIFLKDK